MRIMKDIMVPMPDGVRLATDVFLPDEEGKAYPVIHVRCPYVKDNLDKNEFDENVPDEAKGFSIKKFVEQGYAFTIQDCRGTGKSEGMYKPWIGDAEDGYEYVEWIYRQEWCSGKIGSLGPSNYGSVQLLTASMRPPHLTCIVPMGTDCAMPFFKNGILQLGGSSIWYIQQAYNSAVRGGMDPERFQRMDEKFRKIRENMDEQYNWLPLREVPFANVEEVDMELFFHEFMEHLDDSAHWTGIHNPCDIININVPVLFITNWYDHLAPNVFDMYRTMKNHGTPFVQENLRLYIGPWRKYAGIEGTSEGLWDHGRTLFDVVIDWFDYWLKGKPNGMMERPPVFLHTMGKVEWGYRSSWPLEEAVPVRYFLSSSKGANSVRGDGCLSEKMPENGKDEFDYDPMHPVQSRTGLVIHPGDSLRQSQAVVEEREDVLVYSTDVLENELTVIGRIKAHIWASTSAVDTDFTAKLVDVLPDGETYSLCEGIVRGHVKNGLDKPELLIPGAVYEYDIEMSATGMVFGKGHRIRLEIASSNFPKHDRNMNTGHPCGVDKEGIIAHQTVYHDAQHPSFLELPVVPA